MLKLTELTPNPYVPVRCMILLRIKTSEGRRARFVFKTLVSKLHEFISETKCVLHHHHIPTSDVNVFNPGCLSRLSPFPITLLQHNNGRMEKGYRVPLPHRAGITGTVPWRVRLTLGCAGRVGSHRDAQQSPSRERDGE